MPSPVLLPPQVPPPRPPVSPLPPFLHLTSATCANPEGLLPLPPPPPLPWAPSPGQVPVPVAAPMQMPVAVAVPGAVPVPPSAIGHASPSAAAVRSGAGRRPARSPSPVRIAAPCNDCSRGAAESLPPALPSMTAPMASCAWGLAAEAGANCADTPALPGVCRPCCCSSCCVCCWCRWCRWCWSCCCCWSSCSRCSCWCG
mmetsp:Transcript_38738/g.115139  ORF Transcript_38738/g.115139 Transcript_38738/m.115139 type:complete len:200 (-) Transcript_38738:1836-2435(-)